MGKLRMHKRVPMRWQHTPLDAIKAICDMVNVRGGQQIETWCGTTLHIVTRQRGEAHTQVKQERSKHNEPSNTKGSNEIK